MKVEAGHDYDGICLDTTGGMMAMGTDCANGDSINSIFSIMRAVPSRSFGPIAITPDGGSEARKIGRFMIMEKLATRI